MISITYATSLAPYPDPVLSAISGFSFCRSISFPRGISVTERIMDSAADGPRIGEVFANSALLREGTAHRLAYTTNSTLGLNRRTVSLPSTLSGVQLEPLTVNWCPMVPWESKTEARGVALSWTSLLLPNVPLGLLVEGKSL